MRSLTTFVLLLLGVTSFAVGKPNPNELPMANFDDNVPMSDDFLMANLNTDDTDDMDSDNNTGNPIVIDFPNLPNMTWTDEDSMRALMNTNLSRSGGRNDSMISDNSTGSPIVIKVPNFNNTIVDNDDKEEKRGPSDRIINAWGEAGRGWFPMMAEVGVNGFSGHFVRCSGVILSRQWVLTVARCLFPNDGLFSGSVLVGNNRAHRGQIYFIESYHIHQNYRRTQSGRDAFDIALLKISRFSPMVFNFDTQPALLANPPNVRSGTSLWTAGWGAVVPDGSLFASNLRYAGMRVTECPDFNIPPLASSRQSVICTANGQTRHCRDDAGTILGSIQNGRWFIHGITSYFLNGCPANGATTYTSVGFFRNWILHTMGTN